jgi:hypothetical protein
VTATASGTVNKASQRAGWETARLASALAQTGTGHAAQGVAHGAAAAGSVVHPVATLSLRRTAVAFALPLGQRRAEAKQCGAEQSHYTQRIQQAGTRTYGAHASSPSLSSLHVVRCQH